MPNTLDTTVYERRGNVVSKHDTLVTQAQKAVERQISARMMTMTDYARKIGVNPGLMSMLMTGGVLRPSLARALAREGLIVLPPEPVKMTPATAAVILTSMEPKKIKKPKKKSTGARRPRFAALKDDPAAAAAAVLRNMTPENAAELVRIVNEVLND